MSYVHTLKDYEGIFNASVEDKRAEWLEVLRDAGITKYRIKIIDSGAYREVEIFPIWKASQKKRGEKALSTREAQENLNNRNRQKHLVRMINTNFGRGDIHISLTYSQKYLPGDKKQALKDLQNYLRRVKRYIKKHNLPELKYIAITEGGEGSGVRLHHHVIMNFNTMNVKGDAFVAEDLWKLAEYPGAEFLKPSEFGLEQLGKYLTKEARKKNEKTYSTSKNLEKYKVEVLDGKMNKSNANKLFREELVASEYFEKTFKNHNFVDWDKKLSDYVSGCYMYVQMKAKRVIESNGKTLTVESYLKRKVRGQSDKVICTRLKITLSELIRWKKEVGV